MTPAFRDFCFEGKKGDIDVVKSPFGFHIIRIDNQKNKQKVLKLATFSRKIVPSEATENVAFRNAEEFALAVSKENMYFEVALGKNYKPKPAVGLKALDENVAGLGSQRQIVRWAFGKETKVNDFKRFDLEGSHVVVFVTNATEKGLMSAAKATNRVRPILVNEKKAALINEKLQGASLSDIATGNNTTVKSANGITLKNPTLSGVGLEPKIVGAMYNAELNKVFSPIAGNRGVFAFMLTNKEIPTALPNYDSSRKRIAESRKRLTFKMFEAIKKTSNVEDYRANMYNAN
jgi:peptidyl-prolyl cis-trans isomerase D